MSKQKWESRTKRDLMIEVWEALDCESVGAKELKAIAHAVAERFGEGAVEGPASVARLLADEGAELRHPEVLEFDAEQRILDPYAELFRGVLGIEDLNQAAGTIRKLEELRNTFASAHDKTGLRRVREMAITGKQRVHAIAANRTVDERTRAEMTEMAEWLTVWLRQPEIFEMWLELRRDSSEFRELFNCPDP